MRFASADATPIDCLTAMNLRTGDIITIPGNETLVLSSGTGIDLTDHHQLNTVIYPNPNSGQSTIALDLPESQDIVISVHNQLGQQICQSTDFVPAGAQAFALSLQNAGLYTVSIL